MRCSRFHVVLSIAAAALLALPTSAGAVLTVYSDDFSGAGGTNLNGQAPDVRPGSETWTAATGTPAWKADGSVVGIGHRNAWLPFVPSAGNVYTASLDVNPNTGTDVSDWFSLGFASGAGTTNDFQNNSNGTTAWMLQRVRRTGVGDVQTFLGPGTAGGAGHPTATGTVNLKVVLDTQAVWTAEWFFEGSSIRGPVALASNPTINHVGFGKYEDAQGSVDNFLLEALYDPSEIFSITDLFNTGVDGAGNALGGGATDTHYDLASVPDARPTPFDAVAPASIPGAWVSNDADSRWISPQNNVNDGPGDYIYRTTFTIPNDADLSTASVAGRWGTDNQGRDILINDTSTGQTNTAQFGSLTPFSITSGLTHGVNTMDFVLNNAGTSGNPTGLRVDDIQGTYQLTVIPEPLTMLAVGLSVAGLGGYLRKRQRS